jgi:hypothetical protein
VCVCVLLEINCHSAASPSSLYMVVMVDHVMVWSLVRMVPPITSHAWAYSG